MDRLRDFPEEAWPFFERLLAYDFLPAGVLEAQVRRHLSEFEEECAVRGNLAAARTLSAWSHRLMEGWERASDEDRRLIQAAILYFVMDGDASDDTLPGGLEDDEAVMRSVMAALEGGG